MDVSVRETGPLGDGCGSEVVRNLLTAAGLSGGVARREGVHREGRTARGCTARGCTARGAQRGGAPRGGAPRKAPGEGVYGEGRPRDFS